MPPSDATPSPPPRAYLAPAVLGALVVAFMWDCIFAGRAFILRDVVFDSLPWRRLAARAARDGEIPLWNHLSRFGQPFVAGPQSGFFYPPHHLYDVLPATAAFDLSMALHLFVAALGMYALLRRFEAAREAALLAAIVFAFGTYFTVNLEFMSVMDTLAWAPLTILLTCRIGDVRGDRRRLATTTILLAGVLALQLLAGQVQVLAFTCGAALVFCVATAPVSGRRASAVASVLGLAVAGLFAAGLGMVQILPTLDLIPHSIRAAGVDPGLDIASMSPRHLATLVFPFAFGRPGALEWWGPSLHEFWLGCFHIGLTPLIAVAFVGLRRRRDGVALASVIVLVVGLLVAMGKYTPVYGWLQALPGADLVRWPAKGLQLVAISLSVLSGLGFDALLARREAAAGRVDRASMVMLSVVGAIAVALLVATAVDAAGTAFFLAGGGAPSGIDTSFVAVDARRSAAFLLLGVLALALAAWRAVPRTVGTALVLAASFANLYVLGRTIQYVGDDALLELPPPALLMGDGEPRSAGGAGRVHSDYFLSGFGLYGSRDERAYRAAAAVLAGNTGLPHGIASTCPGDALLLARPDQVMGVLRGLPPGPRARLADVLAIDHEISGPPLHELVAQLAADPRARLPAPEARPSALPDAYLVRRWTASDDPPGSLERLLSTGFDAANEAIEDTTSGVPPLPAPPAGRARAPVGSVGSVQHGWNRVDVDVDVTTPCVLVLTETWHPGWTARVDGEERTIARVNVLFRGVALRPGDRRVTMEYAPAPFRIGAWTSCGILALLAGGLVWFRRRPSSTG